MSPISHFLISWSLGSAFRINRKERLLVAAAGIAPDIDGAGIVYDLIFYNPEYPLRLWSLYHHLIGHNIGFGLLLTAGAFLPASRRKLVAGIVMLSFHLHLFCDIIGARGPDGDQWHIPYLLPFSDLWKLAWDGQWALNAWPNFVITGVMICFVFRQSWKYGISPLEFVSVKANDKFVRTLRNRFGNPA